MSYTGTSVPFDNDDGSSLLYRKFLKIALTKAEHEMDYFVRSSGNFNLSDGNL